MIENTESSALKHQGTLVLGDSTFARINNSIVVNGISGIVANHSKSGQTTPELIINLKRQYRTLPDYEHVVLVTGKNDYQCTPESNLKDFIKTSIISIRSILGNAPRLYVVGLVCRPCRCQREYSIVSRKTRQITRCCDQKQRSDWCKMFNSILEVYSSGSVEGSHFQYIPPPPFTDAWEWDDGIHLSALEHQKYIAHIEMTINAANISE